MSIRIRRFVTPTIGVGALLAVVLGAAVVGATGSDRKDPGARPEIKPVGRASDEPAGPAVFSERRGSVEDAGLSPSGVGWATTSAGLFVTSDGSASWKAWNLPKGASAFDVAPTGLQDGSVLASFDGGARVSVLSTRDSGQHWASTDLGTGGVPISGGQFAHGPSGVAGVLLKHQTGANFSEADWYSPAGDGTKGWIQHGAPIAGKAAVGDRGTVWLAGGASGDQLYRSTDGGAHWTAAVVRTGVVSGTVALDAPAARGNGRVEMAATVVEPSGASLVVLRSEDDGATWAPGHRISVPDSLGPGATLPSSLGGPGLVALAPSGRSGYRASSAATPPARFVPSGLPVGVTSVAFAGGDLGWATFSSTDCGAAKHDCVTDRGLAVSRDGGTTWMRTNPA